MRLGVQIAASLLVLARFATLPLYSYNQEYGYLEAYYSFLARDLPGLVPTLWNSPTYNTPPLYVWVLAGTGKALGYSEMALRLPSFLAWVLTGRPIQRLGGSWALIAWYSFPLSFILAGRVMPDMLLTCLMAHAVAEAYRRRFLPFLAYLVLGCMVKPVAVLVLLAPLALKWWPALERLSLLGTLAAVGAIQGGFAQAILSHATTRWPGYWDSALPYKLVLGAPLALVLVASPVLLPGHAPVWAILGLGLVLFGYAMPDFGYHEYYLLPLLPMVAVLAGWSLRKHWLRAPALTIGGALLILSIVQSGDLWDHRTADMPHADSAEQGLGFVASWYGGGPLRDTSPREGVHWAWSPVVAGCNHTATYDSPAGLERPLYVHSC